MFPVSVIKPIVNNENNERKKERNKNCAKILKARQYLSSVETLPSKRPRPIGPFQTTLIQPTPRPRMEEALFVHSLLLVQVLPEWRREECRRRVRVYARRCTTPSHCTHG